MIRPLLPTFITAMPPGGIATGYQVIICCDSPWPGFTIQAENPTPGFGRAFAHDGLG